MHGRYMCMDVHILVCGGMLMCDVYVDALACRGLQLVSDGFLRDFPLTESGFFFPEPTAHSSLIV